jgi:hypothetical protein
MRVAYTIVLIFAAVAASAPAAHPAPPPQADSTKPLSFEPLRWRHIGPPGNRAIAVAGEPGNPLVMYVGAASGGLWRSVNGLAGSRSSLGPPTGRCPNRTG